MMSIKTVPLTKIKRVVVKNPANATIELITYDNKKAIAELLKLQDIVSKDVEENIFHTSTKEFVDLYFRNGWGLGCYYQNRMIGYIMIQVTNHDENENYPKLIGFDSQKIAETACHRGAGVHPDYRGNHLQIILQDTAANLLKKSGSSKYVMCTVSPENIVSRNNIFASGYVCRGHMDHMYRSYPRDLMLLTLTTSGDE